MSPFNVEPCTSSQKTRRIWIRKLDVDFLLAKRCICWHFNSFYGMNMCVCVCQTRNPWDDSLLAHTMIVCIWWSSYRASLDIYIYILWAKNSVLEANIIWQLFLLCGKEDASLVDTLVNRGKCVLLWINVSIRTRFESSCSFYYTNWGKKRINK